ncbi:MAG: hypothetical protein V1799_18750 [bacterium]
MQAQIKQMEVRNVKLSLIEHPSKDGEMQMVIDCTLPQLRDFSWIKYATLELKEKSSVKLVKKDSLTQPVSEGLQNSGAKAVSFALYAYNGKESQRWVNISKDSLVHDNCIPLGKTDLPNEFEKYSMLNKNKKEFFSMIFDITNSLSRSIKRGSLKQTFLLAGLEESRMEFTSKRINFDPSKLDAIINIYYVN